MNLNMINAKQMKNELVLNHSDHVWLLHGSPPVLKVDICSVFEGVIFLYFTPVALSEFFNAIFQLLCLTFSPLLQHKNMRLLSFSLLWQVQNKTFFHL